MSVIRPKNSEGLLVLKIKPTGDKRYDGDNGQHANAEYNPDDW
jgi:hypothetical protein